MPTGFQGLHGSENFLFHEYFKEYHPAYAILYFVTLRDGFPIENLTARLISRSLLVHFKFSNVSRGTPKALTGSGGGGLTSVH